MKVAGLSYATFTLPLITPFATSRGAVNSRWGIVLRLDTDAGISGFGEACGAPFPGELGLEDVLDELPALAAAIAGSDFEMLEGIVESGALPRPLACALDTAACDVAAKSAGVPVARLLADSPMSEVQVNATIASESVLECTQEAAKAREAGFPCIKLKTGRLGPEDERRRLAAVREAIGPVIALRLDANGAWGAEEAVAMIDITSEYGIEYVEQPVAPGNLKVMARVRAAVPVAVAVDEDVSGLDAANAVLGAGAADVLVIKPMAVGGLRPAREIAEAARAANVGAVVTTMLDGPVGTLAALQAAAALPGGSPACGLATGLLFADSAHLGFPEVRRGRMTLPAAPGLGLGPEAMRWLDSLEWKPL